MELELFPTGGVYFTLILGQNGEIKVQTYISISQIIYLLYGEDEKKSVKLYTKSFYDVTFNLYNDLWLIDLRCITDSGKVRKRTYKMNNYEFMIEKFNHILEEVNSNKINPHLNYQEMEFYGKEKD